MLEREFVFRERRDHFHVLQDAEIATRSNVLGVDMLAVLGRNNLDAELWTLVVRIMWTGKSRSVPNCSYVTLGAFDEHG